MKRFTFLVPALLVFLIGCTSSQSAQTLTKLEAGTQPQDNVGMVVTANPHATKAGAAILRAGGSAVDAAIAIEAVLSLVEPQSSGLGGGGFMVHFDKATTNLTVYDGRETAPTSATVEMFLADEGKKMGYFDAKHSGLSTGVPGMVSMLEMAHADFGVLPWGGHFDYAKSLATEGFEISPRLNGMLVRFAKYMPKTDQEGPTDAYRYLYDSQGQPLPAGHLLKNPEYAKTLEIIAADASAFYTGTIAEQIVAQTSQQPRASGLSLADLAAYKASRVNALCSPYREMKLCGPPPPSSWLAVAMIMGILERAPKFSSAGASDPRNWSLFGEAQRLAYADRDHYVADSAAVMVPIEGLLHPDYLAARASEISTRKAVPKINHGDPWAFTERVAKDNGIDQTVDVAGTTHFVVVDKQGNVVSMTASVESIFGSTRMAGGMMLNNQLTDFSFFPTDPDGKEIVNAVAPGKRPRSSMSPTIVLDADDNFLLATGSPGGNSIIAYTAKTLVGVLDWALTPQQSVELPNLVARGDKVRIEKERAQPALINGLRNYGFEVKESAGENSGLSVIMRGQDGTLVGGVDPRREGVIEVVY